MFIEFNYVILMLKGIFVTVLCICILWIGITDLKGNACQINLIIVQNTQFFAWWENIKERPNRNLWIGVSWETLYWTNMQLY